MLDDFSNYTTLKGFISSLVITFLKDRLFFISTVMLLCELYSIFKDISTKSCSLGQMINWAFQIIL